MAINRNVKASRLLVPRFRPPPARGFTKQKKKTSHHKVTLTLHNDGIGKKSIKKSSPSKILLSFDRMLTVANFNSEVPEGQ